MTKFRVRGPGRAFTSQRAPINQPMAQPTVVRIDRVGDLWSVQGKGRQNLRVVRDDLVPKFVRDAMGEDQRMYCQGRFDRQSSKWVIGERLLDQKW